MTKQIKLSLSKHALQVLEDDFNCYKSIFQRNFGSTCVKLSTFRLRLIKILLNEKNLIDEIFKEFYINDYRKLDFTSYENGALPSNDLNSILNRLESLVNKETGDTIDTTVEEIQMNYLKDNYIVTREVRNIINVNKDLPKTELINKLLCKITRTPQSYIRYYIEYYCSLPAAKREMFFCKNVLDGINNAISKNIMIKLSTYLPFLTECYMVTPYKILPNFTNTHYYLVAKLIETTPRKDKTIKENTKRDVDYPELSSKKIFTVRISEMRIDSVHAENKLTNDEKLQIDKIVSTEHIAYATYENVKIKIRFPEKSVKTFHSDSYGRPKYKFLEPDPKKANKVNKPEYYEYELSCPLFQAKEYFSVFDKPFEISLHNQSGIHLYELIQQRIKDKYKGFEKNINDLLIEQ